MSSLTPEKFQSLIKKIPVNLKEWYFSDELGEKIYEIAEKNKLQIDKSGLLANEIGYVMIGFRPASGFPKTIKGVLDINQEQADNIVRDVNEEIFTKVRKLMIEGSTSDIESGDEDKDVKLGTTEVSAEKPFDTKPTPEETGLRKEDILREIEEGEVVPTKEIIPPTNTGKDFLKENVDEENITVKTEGIVENKLTKPVSVENESEDMSAQKVDRKTYKGGVDPYRESIE